MCLLLAGIVIVTYTSDWEYVWHAPIAAASRPFGLHGGDVGNDAGEQSKTELLSQLGGGTAQTFVHASVHARALPETAYSEHLGPQGSEKRALTANRPHAWQRRRKNGASHTAHEDKRDIVRCCDDVNTPVLCSLFAQSFPAKWKGQAWWQNQGQGRPTMQTTQATREDIPAVETGDDGKRG